MQSLLFKISNILLIVIEDFNIYIVSTIFISIFQRQENEDLKENYKSSIYCQNLCSAHLLNIIILIQSSLPLQEALTSRTSIQYRRFGIYFWI